jgi:hypothetical protein
MPLERLICPFCCKTFKYSNYVSSSFQSLPNWVQDKQASRHVCYCRTKAKVGVSTRRISCVVCIKAKTRCDIALPSCSRCTTKGLRCLYKSSNAPSTLAVQGVPVDERVTVVHHVEAGRSQNYPTGQTTLDCNHILTEEETPHTIWDSSLKRTTLTLPYLSTRGWTCSQIREPVMLTGRFDQHCRLEPHSQTGC